MRHSLTFVGIGPGDPDLITFAAIKAIRHSTLIVYPSAYGKNSSQSAQICSKWIKNKRQIELPFPISSINSERKDYWNKSSKKLINLLKKGEKIVFICLGDISIYSTASYLILYLKDKNPEIEFKIIPGITSFSAASAISGIPLLLKNESLYIMSTPDNQEKFREIINQKNHSNLVIVFLKLGKRWEWVRKILAEKDLLENTLFANKIGFKDQIVIKASNLELDEAPYFSLLVIRFNLPNLL